MAASLTRPVGFHASHRYYPTEEVPRLPTCEAVAAYRYPRIAVRLPGGVVLEPVRIVEDPTLYADRTGLA